MKAGAQTAADADTSTGEEETKRLAVCTNSRKRSDMSTVRETSPVLQHLEKKAFKSSGSDIL